MSTSDVGHTGAKEAAAITANVADSITCDIEASAHPALAPYPHAAQTFYKRTITRVQGTYPGTLSPYTYTYNDPAGVTGTFNVEYYLTVDLNPPGITPDAYPGAQWTLESAPTGADNDIQFLPVPALGILSFDRIVTSFRKPGLYKFKFDLGLAVGESLTPAEALKRTCHVYILLPQAAGGITDWIAQEAKIIADQTDGTATKWESALALNPNYAHWMNGTIRRAWDPQQIATPILIGTADFKLRAEYWLFLGFDYLGHATVKDVSGTPRYNYTDEDKPPEHAFIAREYEPDYVSIEGIVIPRYQVTNLMLAVFWRSLGIPESGLLPVGEIHDLRTNGWFTDQSSIIATKMGFELADAVRAGHDNQWLLDNVLMVEHVGGLPTQDTPGKGFNDVNLWPVPGVEALANQAPWSDDSSKTMIGYMRPENIFNNAKNAEL